MLFLKDPAARLDYAIDWTAALAVGRSIAGSSWQVVPARDGGVRVAASSVEGATTVAWVEGGREGDVVLLVNRVTFSDGLVDERSVTLRVGER